MGVAVRCCRLLGLWRLRRTGGLAVVAVALVCGCEGASSIRLSDQELIGTWLGRDAGVIVIRADATFTVRHVPAACLSIEGKGQGVRDVAGTWQKGIPLPTQAHEGLRQVAINLSWTADAGHPAGSIGLFGRRSGQDLVLRLDCGDPDADKAYDLIKRTKS